MYVLVTSSDAKFEFSKWNLLWYDLRNLLDVVDWLLMGLNGSVIMERPL